MELVVVGDSGESAALKALAACCGAQKKQAVVIKTGETLTVGGETKTFEEAARQLTKLTGSEKILFPENNPEAEKWLLHCASNKFDLSNDVPSIKSLSDHLLFRTFVAEKSRMTAVDVVLYVSVHKWLSEAATEAVQQLVPLLRWFDHMQTLVDTLPKVDVITKFESKKAVVTKKAENKGAKKTDVKPAEPARPLDDPTRLELRVGEIIDVWHHPDADGLYCEKINIGEAEPRQIASGLRKFVPIEKMKGARVVVFANLKPKALRGFPSHGMVLCAKSADGEVVEFVTPPASAKPGDLVTFEGLEGKYEEVLTAKKNADALGAILPGLRSDDKRVAFYKENRMVVGSEPCTCMTVANGTLS